MSSIWLDENTKLKSYSAGTKGVKSIVRIELEINEPESLGYVLRNLADVQKACHPAEQAAGLTRPKRTAIEGNRPLMLTYGGGDDDHGR